MKSYDFPSLYDQERILMLEESAEDELAEQEDFRLAKGRYPLGALTPLGSGLARRRSSNSTGLAGVVEPRPDRPPQ